ncbi:Phosphoesterase HXTX [Chloroherpeton thalassium ATCC 35110]|uniref:Phosphoesterase HXTX n=1 Tax=Chloroherpeton thalassium (strain ATCC 35110 / GB-78) TaxID=517418 RepID=B3QXR5_CHLT3|nr:RNA 2',3'-cyclic phosphodiesterase [Chloroherpeton thalassium]ACF14980.1 Phosphoesterase HXTX [Chloroherpeton thalassium ATCC 35110]
MTANTFVAAPIENTKGWLSQYLIKLPDALRVFDARDLHLTVAFLGKISAEAQHAVIRILEQLSHPAFEISFDRLVALPNAKRMSAISLRVKDGASEAARFIETWREPIFQSVALPPETRPPLPHITIARPKRNATAREKNTILNWCNAETPPSVTIPINRVALYTWSDNRKERQFKILYEKSLQV